MIRAFFVKRWNAYRAKRRLERVPEPLAQDLEIIAGALRAGASLQQAIQVASEEGEGPLAEEWEALIQEFRLGASLDAILFRLENRLPIPAIQSFSTAVAITQSTGGNLADVLVGQAQRLRQEIAFQGKLKALTAQGKISGFVVGAVPFFLMIMLALISPELMTPLFTTLPGQILLILVVVLVTIGGLVIRKIVTIEV